MRLREVWVGVVCGVWCVVMLGWVWDAEREKDVMEQGASKGTDRAPDAEQI